MKEKEKKGKEKEEKSISTLKWVIGAAIVAIPTVLLFLHVTHARPFGFGIKNKKSSSDYNEPSESDIGGLIKQP